jgi:hypothetical protein
LVIEFQFISRDGGAREKFYAGGKNLRITEVTDDGESFLFHSYYESAIKGIFSINKIIFTGANLTNSWILLTIRAIARFYGSSDWLMAEEAIHRKAFKLRKRWKRSQPSSGERNSEPPSARVSIWASLVKLEITQLMLSFGFFKE